MPEGYKYETPTDTVFNDLSQYVPLLLSAIDAELGRPDVWEETDVETALTYIEDLRVYVSELLQNRMIGTIVAVGLELLPAHMLLCDGSTFQAADYPELYAVLSPLLQTSPTTFVTPNLVSKFIRGTSPGNDHATGGADTVTLSTSQIPSHQHGPGISGHRFVLYNNTNTGAYRPVHNAAGPYGIIPDGGALTAAAGGGGSHENRPAFYSLKYAMIAR